jgi:hypothetical protein
MYFEYKGYYFKLKSLKDYQYLFIEDLNEFQWNIVIQLYNYLKNNNKLELYNELTTLSIKQQNLLIMSSMIKPKPYLSIYNPFLSKV